VKPRGEDSPIPRGFFPTIRNEKRNGLESIATMARQRRIYRRNQPNSRMLRHGWQRNTPFQSQ
jgi:hypothetical protein